MHYFILFIFLLSFDIYAISLNFFEENSSFLNSKIKQIECEYSIITSNQINTGQAILIMDDNNYKLSLYDRTIVSDTKIMQTYFQSTNQIFIEDSSPSDTLILNFFDSLKQYIQSDSFIPHSSHNFIDLYYGNAATVHFISDSGEIDSIYISADDIKESKIILHSIELLTPLYHNRLFEIDQSDAFILDLRD